MFDKYEDIMTLEDVCHALRIGKNAAYELVQTGKLKSIRNGRKWFVPKKALQDYVVKQSGLSLVEPMIFFDK